MSSCIDTCVWGCSKNRHRTIRNHEKKTSFWTCHWSSAFRNLDRLLEAKLDHSVTFWCLSAVRNTCLFFLSYSLDDMKWHPRSQKGGFLPDNLFPSLLLHIFNLCYCSFWVYKLSSSWICFKCTQQKNMYPVRRPFRPFRKAKYDKHSALRYHKAK